MELTNILTYQKADIERKKIHDEIRKHPDYKKMKDSREEYDKAKLQGAESDALAKKVMEEYAACAEQLESKVKTVESICVNVSAGDLSEEKEQDAVAELETLAAEIAELEKKIATLKDNAEKALHAYAAAQKKGKLASEQYKISKAKYEEYKKNEGGKLVEATAKCEELKKSVEPELLAIYERKVAENIRPAFVANIGDDKSPTCGGCGMSQPKTASAEFNEKGYVTCEQCHRIIYKP